MTERTHIPRASRPFKSPMTLAVRNSRVTVAPDASLRPAGAHIPEADPAQAVATYPSVIDAERHAAYRDGVEHVTTLDGLSGGHKSCSTSSTPPAEPVLASGTAFAARRGEGRSSVSADASAPPHLIPLRNAANAEADRQGRLSRWQEQR